MSIIVLNYFALIALTFAWVIAVCAAANYAVAAHYGCGFSATFRHFAADVAAEFARIARTVATGAESFARAAENASAENSATVAVDMGRVLDAGETRINAAIAERIAATDAPELGFARTEKLHTVN